MDRRFPLIMLPLSLQLAACETLEDEPVVSEVPPPVVLVEDDPDAAWQGYANIADVDRIGLMDEAWAEGLAAVRAADFVTAVEQQGELLDPEAGLPKPDPTPGSYECRLVKLGAAKPSDPTFIAYNPFFCYVELESVGDDDEGRFTIVKQTGSQRPAGRLWDAGDRFVFLGSLALGSEREPLAYGEDPERDMAGVWERIGPFRWRLVIPFPRNGGILDVFELTPVADQPE